jgi:hypothetical protein
MPSLSAKDRVSLCQFTFADGRRCRTPRTGKNPHFCFHHAQKEARALAEESLSKDLAYFFSGDYLSACDLSTAMGRLIPAVIRGDVKPRTARTVAYMAQILLQSIHISQREYGYAFGDDGWRKSIRHSVNANYNRRFPHAPKPEQSPSPHPQPAQPAQADHPAPTPPQPAATTANCHSEPAARREESAFSPLPAASPTSAHAQPQQPVPGTQPAASTMDKPQPISATQSVQPVAPTPQPNNQSPRPTTGPSRETPWWNFGETGNIPPDSHLL